MLKRHVTSVMETLFFYLRFTEILLELRLMCFTPWNGNTCISQMSFVEILEIMLVSFELKLISQFVFGIFSSVEFLMYYFSFE